MKVPQKLGSLEIDASVGLVASFGAFIPKKLIDRFPRGMFNVHPSLLPKYRGASPIQHALMNGDKETGVSIIDLSTKGFDAGKVYAMENINLESKWMFVDACYSLGEIGGRLLANVVNSDIKGKEQVGQVTFAPKITRDMAQVSFLNMNADEIYNRFRAISHQVKQSNYKFQISMSVVSGNSTLEVKLRNILPPNVDSLTKFESPVSNPGSFMYDRKTRAILIHAKDTWLSCNMFSVQGKSQIYDSAGFLRYFSPKSCYIL